MYFHHGISEVILFREWVPTTESQFMVSCFIVFVIALLFEMIRGWRVSLEKKWQSTISIPRGSSYPPFIFKVDVTRGVLNGVELGISYLLMFIAMTYNIGLFVSLVIGFIIGKIYTQSRSKKIVTTTTATTTQPKSTTTKTDRKVSADNGNDESSSGEKTIKDSKKESKKNR
eukprot:gene1229-1552_t